MGVVNLMNKNFNFTDIMKFLDEVISGHIVVDRLTVRTALQYKSVWTRIGEENGDKLVTEICNAKDPNDNDELIGSIREKLMEWKVVKEKAKEHTLTVYAKGLIRSVSHLQSQLKRGGDGQGIASSYETQLNSSSIQLKPGELQVQLRMLTEERDNLQVQVKHLSEELKNLRTAVLDKALELISHCRTQ